MQQLQFHSRKAVKLENDILSAIFLIEGGHLACLQRHDTQVNPMWIPPWPSLEPSSYDPHKYPEYGGHVESRLLAGIMGHNICLDIFGPPSEEEAAAGLDVHGEAPVARYDAQPIGELGLRLETELSEAGLKFRREVHMKPGSPVVLFKEQVTNLRATDRPVAWTQHVTLGPPFLEKGATRLEASGTRSKVYEGLFAGEHSRLMPAAEFQWPQAPLRHGGFEDLSVFTSLPVSGEFTATLMNPAREQAFFMAFSPRYQLVLGYVWSQKDFPWLGRWEENHSRQQAPWNGRTLALGLEFGVSPFAETRRQQIERGHLFGVPVFRWIPARATVETRYCAFLIRAATMPPEPCWDGAFGVSF